MSKSHLYFIKWKKEYFLPHAFFTEKDAEKIIDYLTEQPTINKKEDYEIAKIYKDDPEYEWDVFNWGIELLAKEI